MTIAGHGVLEEPMWFRSGRDDLLGILTHPRTEPRGITVVAHPGGHWIPSTHRNSAYVRLAERLAADGVHTFRFDYHGVGESTGEVAAYRLDRPFVDDSLAAVAAVRERESTDIVLVGSCFGARTALAAAAQAPVRGLVLLWHRRPCCGRRGRRAAAPPRA
jgi:alpha/beta superfamily hydrolase